MTSPQKKMNEIMSFCDFEFPSNPRSLCVSSQRAAAVNGIFGKKSAVQSVCLKPAVISGSGVFIGDSATDSCNYLSHLLNTGKTGLLCCPSVYPIEACLTKFTYTQLAGSGKTEYSFEFTQIFGKRKDEIKLNYDFAEKGETAFDTAARTGVKIDDIMRLNDFETPFDICEGDKVIIREDNS